MPDCSSWIAAWTQSDTSLPVPTSTILAADELERTTPAPVAIAEPSVVIGRDCRLNINAVGPS